MTTPLPVSARLAWCGTAWLRGSVVADLAVDAIIACDATHRMVGLPGTQAPEPDIYARSSGDGTLTHLGNWLDCIRSRKTPNANIRVAHQAARTSHIANVSLRSGRPVRWNPATETIESD